MYVEVLPERSEIILRGICYLLLPLYLKGKAENRLRQIPKDIAMLRDQRNKNLGIKTGIDRRELN